MVSPESAFEQYVFEILGIATRLCSWDKERRLPPLLKDLYSVFTCRLLDRTCLVLAARSDADPTPAQVGKHISKVGEIEPDVEVIYLPPALSSFNRKRLIALKIPFVVPGRQMYLPFLGLDLREYFKKRRAEKPVRFRPATQAVFWAALYAPAGATVSPSQLAEELGYSQMSMSRAFDEIEATGLVEIRSKGRTRVFQVPKNREQLLNDALPYLSSPVRKKITVSGLLSRSGLVLAGETALSRYGMLSEPAQEVYAASARTWQNKEQTEENVFVPAHEGDCIEIEIWKYPPELFARGEVVDPLSLYLSLRHLQDDRVAIALEHLLKESIW